MKDDKRFNNYSSYIMASYVQFIEASGARVVPLIMSDSAEVTREKINKLNGVLLPGGSGGYQDFGKIVFDEVVQLNDEGQFYPMWGICEGHEYLVNYTADAGFDALDFRGAHHLSLPLIFTLDPTHSRFYGDLGERAFDFESSNFTYNSHKWGLDPLMIIKDKGLNDFWTLTAVSKVPNNGTDPMHFVASMEAKKYPIFTTQYHPEKPS